MKIVVCITHYTLTKPDFHLILAVDPLKDRERMDSVTHGKEYLVLDGPGGNMRQMMRAEPTHMTLKSSGSTVHFLVRVEITRLVEDNQLNITFEVLSVDHPEDIFNPGKFTATFKESGDMAIIAPIPDGMLAD